MRFYLTFIVLFVSFLTRAQFSDDFSDGDFTMDPTWSGTTDNFEITADFILHLNAPEEADTSYLSTPSTLIDDVTWDFWLKMEFNPSSSNLTRFYLVADQENLKEALNGYFVMVGNTPDEISLYRQDGLTITKIIDGTDGTVDASEVNVRVRVNRDALGNWELFHDNTGGFTFVSEGSVLDNTYTTTDFSGVLCKYTSSRADKFYFDDIGVPYEDAVSPTIEDLFIISDTEIDVVFSEPVELSSAETTGNYLLDNGIGNPISAILDGDNPALVHLVFSSEFESGLTYLLTIENVEDLAGNPVVDPTAESFIYFNYVPALENDVIFTEFLIDPSPVVGLPEVEYIEIYNRSETYFDLTEWTLNDNTTFATLGSYLLAPDQYVVLCGEDEGVLFGIENYLEVSSLPTLTNSEDYLVLRDSAGVLLDSVYYKQSWYNDPDKDDGGWSLERKHLDAPCSGQNNWSASAHMTGGTPGEQNSVWTDEDDILAPTIINYTVSDEGLITLYFDEPLDTSIDLSLSFDPAVDEFDGSFLDLASYEIATVGIEANIIYQLQITTGADCWGNELNSSIQFGIAGDAEVGDIILNEVLFNPQTGGSDYVELVNISSKIIDLHELYIANWSDSIANFEQINSQQFLLFPDEYVVLSEDTNAVIDDFLVYGIGRFIETDLPTFPNDSGTVFLMGPDSLLLDYFHYDEDYHYPLLNSVDGKSLERISFGGGMNNPNNWHTASENVNWGTPGYLNSQFASPVSNGNVSVDPSIFSPDNDGYQDVLSINFDLVDLDNNVDVNIYDNQGRLIRQLADNYFIGQSGLLNWDGINDEGQKAAIGTYIILVDVKNSAGTRTQYKLVGVLAGQL